MDPAQHANIAADEFRPISHTINGSVRATGLSRSRLYELIKNNILPVFHAGRRTLIYDADLRLLIDRLRSGEIR
jgi:hypothetical protein